MPNTIKVKRGKSAALNTSTEKLQAGEILYNLDKNYLTVGAKDNDALTKKPVAAREIVGYTGDTDSKIGASTTEAYSIKYDTQLKIKDGDNTLLVPKKDGTLATAEDITAELENYYTKTESDEKYSQATNLENGNGGNSLQQKVTADTREFALPGQERPTPNVPTDLDGTYSTGAIGEQSTELNGRGRAVGKRSFVANNRNLVLGDYASAFGNANIAKGNNAFVAGTLNRVDKTAAAFGYNNYVNADSAFVTGSFNTVTGSNATVVSGQGNTASGNEAIAIGLNTTASGRDSFAGGSGAEATSDCTFAYGVQTKATKTGAIALGYQAEANGANSFAAGVQAKTSAEYGVAIGYGAEANAQHAVAIGHNAKANAPHAVAIGEGNEAVTQGQLVVGRWARPDNYLFAVGNGTKDGRSLAFLVGQDGRATVYGAPKEDTDVVRKKELDTKLNLSEFSVLTQEQVDLLF